MKFNREQILNRYWELANLSSEITKGNITGQLKALDCLREELALAAADKPGKSQAQQFYRSAWMDLPTPDREM